MTHDPEQEHTAGGESPDRPYEPNEPVPAEAGHAARVGVNGAGPSAVPRGLWRRQSVRARAVTAAATVVALGLGGTVAYAATSGDSGNGASVSASPSASAPRDGSGGRHGHGHGPWFGFGGVHGEATVKDRDTGEWVVRTWQRGAVEKVDGDQVTVRSADGTQWTWTVNSDTKVHHDGASGTGAGALEKGEKATLVGTRADDGDRTATRVVAGAWKAWEKDKARDKGKGRGDWRDRFPGHGPRDGRLPSPSASQSPTGNGTAT
ncbi:hypothetical protein GCM10027074_57210 [Streptomyces deserti]